MFVIEIRTPDPTPDSPGINQSRRPRISEALSLSRLQGKKSGGNQATAACMKIFFLQSIPWGL